MAEKLPSPKNWIKHHYDHRLREWQIERVSENISTWKTATSSIHKFKIERTLFVSSIDSQSLHRWLVEERRIQKEIWRNQTKSKSLEQNTWGDSQVESYHVDYSCTDL